MGAFNRLSAGRGLSACLQVKGRYSSFLTATNVYVGTGRYITNELYIGAYVTRRRATKAKGMTDRERERAEERQRQRKRELKTEGEAQRMRCMNNMHLCSADAICKDSFSPYSRRTKKTQQYLHILGDPTKCSIHAPLPFLAVHAFMQ